MSIQSTVNYEESGIFAVAKADFPNMESAVAALEKAFENDINIVLLDDARKVDDADFIETLVSANEETESHYLINGSFEVNIKFQTEAGEDPVEVIDDLIKWTANGFEANYSVKSSESTDVS